MTGRRAGLVAALVLAIAYAGTLAPGVTFWDAGEFITAAHALGIPHPPGTPLFVMLLNLWARALPMLPFALRTNAFSAVSTAIACGVIATFVANAARSSAEYETSQRRATTVDPGWMGLAAALCAGGMFSVWSNATETEVYAAALALAMAMLWCAERAGRLNSTRWRILTAYLFGLAVPLHISALVAAPAAVFLASSSPGSMKPDFAIATAMAAAAVSAMALGTMSRMFFGIAGALAVAAVLVNRKHRPARPTRLLLGGIGAATLAATAVLFLLIRSRHDPSINQGNPASLDALVDVIARRQYDVAPLWPRRAPIWIQIGNWFEYADWQTALSFAPTVIPTFWRTITTIGFAILGVIGAARQREIDRRGWLAVLILTLCGSLGVVVYLNLKASPSFGWGVLADNVLREARERDYFFVLGFVGWGLWAGIGSVWLARRHLRAPAVGVLVASLPIACNWQAVSRRHEPEALEPVAVARALLGAAPRNAVLFVAGDNDTYPLWYAQEVDQLRRDVTIVTLPLLPAQWYVDELQRRHQLAPPSVPPAQASAAALVARSATKLGRPIAAASTVTADERAQLGSCWKVVGLLEIAGAPSQSSNSCYVPTRVTLPIPKGDVWVDSAAAAFWSTQILHWLGATPPRGGVDPVDDYFFNFLGCPERLVARAIPTIRASSLDSLCNR